MTNEEYHAQKRVTERILSRGKETLEAFMGLETGAFHEILMKVTEESNPGWKQRQHHYSRYSPMIYFIQVGDDGPIKIGLSGNPYKRLAQLQTAQAHLLNLILTFAGDREMEKWLHEKCKKVCIGGEWFHNSPQLMERIELLRSLYYPNEPQRESPVVITQAVEVQESVAA